MNLPSEAKPGTGERLLLVDDDPDSREAMQRRFTRRGYQIETVEDARAALDALSRSSYDLMLLDHNMPGMTGLALLAVLRQTYSSTDLPIVMLTAQADSQHLIKAFELGANDYLSKPVDFEVALARIGTQIERRKAELKLRESEQRYALAVQGANGGLWDWDLASDTVHFSERWKSIAGGGEIGSNPNEWFSRIHPADEKRVRLELRSHIEGLTPEFESEHRLRQGDGTYRWVHACGMAVRTPSGQATRLAGSLADVHDNKVTDPLTGLANRQHFEDRLGELAGRYAQDPSRLFAVLIVDLDHFKIVNDSLGQPVGDELLREVARRITSVAAKATVARLGGDQFAILAEGLQTGDDAAGLATQILAAVRQSYRIGDRDIFSGASVGMALPVEQAAAGDVLRNAEMALNRAKRDGRNRAILFDHKMKEDVIRRFEIEADLRRAVEQGCAEFEVYYQPKMSAATGLVEGMEALVRWNHPAKGLLPPAAFIAVAEETGLSVPLGRWVLSQACRQLIAWQRMMSSLHMAVNISSHQLRDASWAASVREVLGESGANPADVCLQITESVLMDQSPATLRDLFELKTLGVQIQIDDFGTGYSSLAYLTRFPLDGPNGDRSLVGRIATSDPGTESVRNVATPTGSMGLASIAAGIDSAETPNPSGAMDSLAGQVKLPTLSKS